jgi:hypothetical protein
MAERSPATPAPMTRKSTEGELAITFEAIKGGERRNNGTRSSEKV